MARLAPVGTRQITFRRGVRAGLAWCGVWLLATWAVTLAQESEPITPQNAETLTRVQTLEGHAFRVNSLAFGPDGTQLVSGSDDITLILWDVASGEPTWTADGQLNAVRSVDVTADGRTALSTGFNNVAFLWDLPSQTRGRSFSYPAAFNDGSFAPDDASVAFAIGDGSVRIYDVEAGTPLADFTTEALRVEQVAYSPDGTQLAAGTGFPEDRVWVWEIESGETLLSADAHTQTVQTVAFSPDGDVLASGGGDGQLILWDVDSGEARVTVEAAHESDLYDVAFNADGTLLASVGFDGLLKLWDTATGDLVHTLEPDEPGSLLTVDFSADGTQLAAGGEADVIWVWGVVPGGGN